MVFIALGAAWLAAALAPQGAEVRYANVAYRLPAGWSVDPGHEYVPYMKVGASKVASMTISRPQPCTSYLQDASGLFFDMTRSPAVIDSDGPRSFATAHGPICMFLAVRQNSSIYGDAPIASIAALVDVGGKSQQILVDVYEPKRYEQIESGAEKLIRSMTFSDAPKESPPPRWQTASGKPGLVASLDVSVTGGGPYVQQITHSHAHYKVARTLSAQGIPLAAGKPPLFERSVLNAMTGRGESVLTYAQDRPHPAAVRFDDEDYHDGDIRVPVGSKEHPRFSETFRWTAPPGKAVHSPIAFVDGLRIAIDRVAGNYVIALPGLSGGVAMSYVDYHRTDVNVSKTGGRVVYPIAEIPLGLFANLYPNSQFTGGALSPTVVRRLPPEAAGKDFAPIVDEISVKAYYKPWGPVTITYKWRIERP